jgi:hypothetical protein
MSETTCWIIFWMVFACATELSASFRFPRHHANPRVFARRAASIAALSESRLVFSACR